MNSVQQVDELVKEYLLFRGFSNTFRAFEQECRNDKDKGFQADKIIEELNSYIASSDINGLLDYWKYLDLRYFSRLDARFFGSVKKFETSLLRNYLVYATQQKRRDKVIEFFDTFGTELNGNPEWSKWFGLPFSKNPATDPSFETFFTKQWLDKFTVSLHNFLNTIFQHMPLPSLLCFNLDRLRRRALQNEIDSLKTELENGDTEIISLKQKVAQCDLAGSRRQSCDNLREKNEKVSNHQYVPRFTLNTSEVNLSSSLSLSRSTTLSGKHETGSDQNGVKTPTDERSMTPISEYDTDELELRNGHAIANPFTVTSQELFLENTSGISVAKFSHQGDLIASCDVDNVIRIWSYTGTSSTLKLSNQNSNILSLEWEARSDKLLLYGTDERLVKVYNKESRSIVHEFQMDDRFPRVNQISCSPVESLFACSGSPRSIDDACIKSVTGSLITWNLKTMTIQDTFRFEASSNSPSSLPLSPIETIKFNHNGQMLVTGDKSGSIRIFDIRTLAPIMKWNISSTSKSGNGVICSSLYSFDENSIYVVEDSGELSQWSVHKPGLAISQSKLQGFPPTIPTTLINFTPTSTKTFRKRATSTSSVRSTKSTRSTSSIPSIVIGTETISHYTPTSRVPMVAFSGDTDYLVCVGGNDGTQGVIYQTSNGDRVQVLESQKQYLTSVDWTNSTGNTILTAAIDGTVRVTKMEPSTSHNVL
ncbi:8981_t:CDS:10 [Funneliformis geosporum]|uniref:14462_t:CDS:1 n=1 Tax=Funneliformis geosporum TaxID=1117311 RepID=A0A9W4SQN3_9GLOM|nr:8981_t:CDS:10 [Funneliformis geosporum]CAI2177040.1 14462_t:CDS:10 [Funneliformis geosporum]